MVDLPQQLIALIFETIKLLLENYNDSIEYSELNAFITKQYKDRKVAFSSDELEQLILTICTTESHNNNFIRILKNLIAILHEVAPERIIKINDKKSTLFTISLSEEALISLFSVSDEAFQNKIQRRILESLEQTNDANTYYDALIHSIIQPKEKYENKLFESADNDTKGDSNYTIYCANLFLDNKLINKDKFIVLIKRDKSLSLVIDPDNFDYKQFDPQLLSSLTSKSLEIISSNKKAYNFIHTELKKYLSDVCDEKLIKIYIDHFS